MKLSLLLSVFALLLGSCDKKNTPAPAPEPVYELQGRWQLESSTDTDYTSDGKVAREATTAFKPGGVLEITATEFISSSDGRIEQRAPYTRTDNIVKVGATTDPSFYNATIKELTANKLRLTNTRFGATGTYPGTTTLAYSR